MATKPVKQNPRSELRARAVSRLSSEDVPSAGNRWTTQTAAFQALYEMALSPATAPGALALLHELQVHQVELDLQADELRRSRLEIETTLARQAQIYDFAPVGLLTIDLALAVSELNYMAASVFGVDRDALAGLSLDGFLDQDSARALRSALQSLSADDAIEPYGIQLMPRDGARRSLHASLSRDPEGHGFLLAVLPVDPKAHFA